MNTIINKLVLFLLLLLPLFSYSQRAVIKHSALYFPRSYTDYSYTSNNFISKGICFSQQQVIKPFDHNVEYPAFFCKMELNMREHCNVWIKLHAGDYDIYNRSTRSSF
jgi:hypothetical protein